MTVDQIGLSDALRRHFDLKSVKPELLQLLRKAVVNDIEREQLTALLAGGVRNYHRGLTQRRILLC